MTAIIVAMALIPIWFGFFMSILFVPLVMILAIITSASIVLIYPIYRLVKPILTRKTRMTDARVTSMPIEDDNIPLVDFTVLYPQFFSKLSVAPEDHVLGRSEVGKMLLAAQELLPEDLMLRIKNGYVMSENIQILQHASWKDTSGHDSGGAVDVTLVSKSKIAIDMGPKQWKDTQNSNSTAEIDSTNISDSAVKNRSSLRLAMTGAGFINNPFEWWHWSFGDQYWAYQSGISKHAHFGKVAATI